MQRSPKKVYAEDLLVLAKQGWVGEEAGTYHVTEAGKRICDEAEALTDTYFFAPWSCLNEYELDEVSHLAEQLRDGLKNWKVNKEHVMNLKSIWSALEDVYDVLGGYGFAAMDKAATEMELAPDWTTWLFAIWLFGSEPITTANFMRIFPYGLAHHNEECFVSAAQHGYLISDGRNGYTPTEFGMKAAQKVWREAGDSIAGVSPMPEALMEKAFDYLARIGEAALSAPEPPSHYFMSHKRENYRLFQILCPLERFIILFGELAAYRDDMYVATWSAHGVEGHAWDMLDFLSHSDAVAFADLHAKLSRRGVTEEVHARDVKELARRGWAEESSGVVKATEAGKRVRAEVEAETEHLFFAPWGCLSEAELDDLLNLARQTRDELRATPIQANSSTALG